MDSFKTESKGSTFRCSDSYHRSDSKPTISQFIVFSFLLMLGWSVQAQVTFQNTTNSIGGPFHEGESWGASWGHMDDDVYPDLFVNNHAMKSSLLRNNGDGTFSERIDVADLSGTLTNEPNADTHGGAWADYDNDGDQDLFVSRSSRGSRLYLFENNGQGRFTERSASTGNGAVGGGRMATLFDYDNDGRLDLAGAGNEGNDLFRWNGNRFIDVGNTTGVAGTCLRGSHSLASNFFDTGLIFLCSSTSAVVETAFDTRGGATPFNDVSDKFDHFGAVPDVVLGDFNNDLKMDMFGIRGIIRPVNVAKVSNQRIEAWISRGGTQDYFASFSFTGTGSITIDVAARNVNKNKRDTIFIGNSGYHPSRVPFTLSPNDNVNNGSAYAPEYRKYGLHVDYDQASQVWTVALSGGGSGSSEGAFISINGNNFSEPVVEGLIPMDLPVMPRFLMNNGNRLVISSNSKGVGNVQCGSIAAADFDNDMDIDLYLACRNSVENTKNRLYLNDGTGQFSLVSNTGGEGLLGVGVNSGAGTAESVVYADYDVDGFIDLFVTNGNRLFPHFVQDGYSAGGPDQFYRNTTNNGNKWIELDLQGVNSNRDGFGAKVIVTAGGVSQLREQNGKIHRWSHDHKRLHFGLANNNTANIRIEWPNGEIDIHNGVVANKLYKAIQGGSLNDITPNGGNNGNSPLSINDTSEVEGNSAQLTVSRASAGSAVSVDYETINQSAVSGDDYVAKSGTLNFTASQTSRTITIETISDDLLEGTESFNVVLSNPSGTAIAQGLGTVDIIDGTPGGDSCGAANYSTSQSNDKGLYVWQDCANPNKWSIRVNAGGGSWTTYGGAVNSNLAISSVDTIGFESSDNFQLLDSNRALDFFMGTAGAGEDGLDYIASSDADLCLTLGNNLPIFYGANAVPVSEPLNLIDIASPCAGNSASPEISIDNVSQTEGGFAQLTVSLSSSPTSSVTVDYVTIEQSATAAADYVAQSGTISFDPAQTSQTLSISTLTDALIEGDEDFTVMLSNPVGATIAQNTGTVTIVDVTTGGGGDCGAPNYNSSQSADRGLYVWQDCVDSDKWSVRVNAGGGSWTTYDGGILSNLAIGSVETIGFENSDKFELLDSDRELDFFMGTANAGEDGIDFNSPTGSQLCLTLNSDRPIFYGANAIAVMSPVNLNDIAQACGTTNTTPLVTVDSLSVMESAGVAQLTLTLSEASSDTVSVDYATVDGTAVAISDYVAQSGTISFAPNEISKTVAITIVDDANDEPNEEFSLVLSNAIGIQIAAGNGVVTITEGNNSLACGMPSISAATEAALFIWKDCGNSELWSFRATAGGGSSIRYNGTIDSDQVLSSVSTFSFEGIDSFQLTNSDQTLDFVMKMGNNGQDGISFDLGASTDSCVDVQPSTSVPVLVGSQKMLINPPFSLNKLGPC